MFENFLTSFVKNLYSERVVSLNNIQLDFSEIHTKEDAKCAAWACIAVASSAVREKGALLSWIELCSYTGKDIPPFEGTILGFAFYDFHESFLPIGGDKHLVRDLCGKEWPKEGRIDNFDSWASMLATETIRRLTKICNRF